VCYSNEISDIFNQWLGLRSEKYTIGVIRDPRKLIKSQQGLYSNNRIHANIQTHSYASTKATYRIKFFSMETASIKEPLVTEVNDNTIGEFYRYNR
jgi:hypothetical protein